MNKWTQKSLDLANSPGYLDKLTEIYPVHLEIEREISKEVKDKIRDAFVKKEKDLLIKNLLELPKFPINDPYVASLRRYPELIKNNPKTITRIADKIFAMDPDTIIKLASTPKSPSRQMGNNFKEWLKTQGIPLLNQEEFEQKSFGFLKGSDKKLGEYIAIRFRLKKLEKGLDMVLKIKSDFFIGEAKFITDIGGGQGNQFRSALRVFEVKKENINGIAIIDGIPWFKSKSGMYKKIIDSNELIISALLLKEFINDSIS